MKYSEYTSAELENLRIELAQVQENIKLLKRHNVFNLIEFTDKEEKIVKQIEHIEKERCSKTQQEKDEIIVHNFIRKESLFYGRTESASISGDTVGDPLKDTSGPSLNILIKLSSILSVVFGPLFLKTSYFSK